MKLFAALGPGDIVAVHRSQISRQAFLSEVSITYSEQLLEWCREQGVETLALSYHRRVDTVRDGCVHVENRPRVLEGRSGLLFHLSYLVYAAYLALRARRFGADIAIINFGSTHPFALAAIRLLGIPVVVNFHGALWPSGFEPTGRWARRLLSLDAWFFRHVVAAVAGVSPECGRQVQQLAGKALPFFEFRAQFRSEGFQCARRDDARTPFRIVFASRAERRKGVLDIPVIAERLRESSRMPFLFDVCGDGSALPELRRIVAAKKLDDIVTIHGALLRPDLLGVYARAHAVIVPTRHDFSEGLPKVCAEAVLSGLPIITTRLCNALPVLGRAVLEAEPENIESYVAAAVRLAEDRVTYDRLHDACPDLARQFLDRSQSLPAAIDRLLAHVFPGWKPLDTYDGLFDRIVQETGGQCRGKGDAARFSSS